MSRILRLIPTRKKDASISSIYEDWQNIMQAGTERSRKKIFDLMEHFNHHFRTFIAPRLDHD